MAKFCSLIMILDPQFANAFSNGIISDIRTYISECTINSKLYKA